ncbi:hypothetical protein FRC11_000623 [Ceratobasidium sp. 423]|nr:hypothetical protein FRC11_000623 [Ceratobasidium sp. 423]
MERFEETLRTLAAPMEASLVIGGAVLLLMYTWDWPGSRRSDMPPGPRPLPIIGNLLNLKPTNVYEQLRQLNLDYGPIASLKIGSGTLIVIGGDGSQVRELYDKRGTIYSGRPLQMVTEIAGGAYGLRCENYHDPTVQEVEDTMRLLSNLLVPGGKPPVEDFPLLNYLPEFVSPWKAKCKQLGQKMDKLYSDLADIGVQRGMQGLNTDNLAYKLRLGEEGTGLTRHQQAFICGIALEGGTDIVAAVILTCLLALVSHPAAQERAHEELDTMYNEETLPRWYDEQAMPFVRAIIKETIRWRPPLPLTVPHRLDKDDYYGGYFLPKGSQLFCIAWTIHTNAERYEEPELFKPERFLNHSMSMAESLAQGDPLKRDHFAFGAGRRVCPGIQKAEQDIFIAISRLLWAFNFSSPTGASVSTDYSTAFMGEGVRIPKNFPLVVTPRSQRRVQAIEEAMLSARDIFSQYGTYRPATQT